MTKKKQSYSTEFKAEEREILKKAVRDISPTAQYNVDSNNFKYSLQPQHHHESHVWHRAQPPTLHRR